MGFHVTSDPEFLQQMYPGQVTYTVKPILGIPLFWMTEITHVEPGKFLSTNNGWALIPSGTTSTTSGPLPAAWK